MSADVLMLEYFLEPSIIQSFAAVPAISLFGGLLASKGQESSSQAGLLFACYPSGQDEP